MKKRLKGLCYRLFIVIFAAVFLYSGYRIVEYYIDSNANRQEYQAVYESVVEQTESQDNSKPKKNKINFDKLVKMNSDALGWVNVPETPISYPVVKSENNDYYLNHNFKKEYSVYGVPFADYRVNQEQMTYQNIIIYGHHMKDGSMFAGLNKYVDIKQYKKSKYVYLESDKRKRTFQIISVYKIDAAKDNGENLKCNFQDKKEFNKYVAAIIGKSFYATEMPNNYKNNLVSLCTCEYSLDDGRLIVVGIEI